ncbi:hypothetical protein BLNAU_21807 [Blattamonas nauphoetae]|uniref:Uncharacterized protein n=1 Tax=Blattamonas nauphoetae TaxID=2049346 RepID=A0ABQ9WUW2_9EUKA|nr:hypothetical protein BLNAU_21807 [Blattamonas nauphoetae]
MSDAPSANSLHYSFRPVKFLVHPPIINVVSKRDSSNGLLLNESDLCICVYTKSDLSLYLPRDNPSPKLILLRREPSVGRDARRLSSSHVVGALRQFPRNWEQVELCSELAEVLSWIPPCYEFQPSIPVWGRFCFNLAVIFSLFSLRLKIRRLFLLALTEMEESSSDTLQNGISLGDENEMLSQATFMRILHNSHSLIETNFRNHQKTIQSFSLRSGVLSERKNESLHGSLFASLFMELKTAIQHEFIPHIPPSSPDIEALLRLLNAYFGKNVFDSSFDYLHPDSVLFSSSPAQFFLPKTHSGVWFVRREIIALVQRGIPLRAGTELMGLDQMFMDASAMTVMNRTYSLVQSLLVHSKTQHTRENLLPTIDPTKPDSKGESSVVEVVQTLPATSHFFDYITDLAERMRGKEVYHSFILQETVMMEVVNTQFQTSILSQDKVNKQKMFRNGVRRLSNKEDSTSLCDVSMMNSLPLPPHVHFSLSDIAAWIRDRHQLLDAILHTPNFTAVYNLSLFHYPDSFLSSARFTFYNEVLNDWRRGIHDGGGMDECLLLLTRRFNDTQATKPCGDHLGLESICVPSVFAPPFRIGLGADLQVYTQIRH